VASLAPASGPGANIRLFAQPRGGRAKLRVGVFADRAGQPRWLVEALAKVAASEFAELAYVAIEGEGAAPRPGEPLPWRAYRTVDRWVFGVGGDPCAEADIALLVPASRRIAPSEATPVDVAFVASGPEDAAPQGLARYGAWRYCFGEGEVIEVPLAGVRELLEAAPVTGSGIRIRRPGDAADRLASVSWSRIVPFSFARSRDNMLAKSADFLARTLRELHAHGTPWLEQATVPARPLGRPAFPRGAALAANLARLGARVAQRAAEHKLTIGQWQIAWRFAEKEPWTGSLDGFRRLVPPKDRFWADPFPIEANGRHYIFFEELPFAAGKAHISVVEVDRSGRVSEPVPVLVRDYHLSYPFLVEEGGALYMVPETAENRTIEAYRCVEFPHRWKLEKVLVRDVRCADATFHRDADRWWMFTTMGRDSGELNDELAIFHADRFLGDWKPHRRNPVKSDVRGARPAGRLFRLGNALYRPGQVCTPIYGSAIALNRVTRLDEREYAEEEARRIVPAASDAVIGLHTINRVGPLSVTDVFLRRPRFGA